MLFLIYGWLSKLLVITNGIIYLCLICLILAQKGPVIELFKKRSIEFSPTNYFAAGQSSLRVQTFSRYSKFVQKLLQSPSKEIRFLGKVLKSDTRSNIWILNNLTNVNIILTNKYQMRSAILVDPIQGNDQWRVRLLNVLLDARKSNNCEDLNLNKEQLDSMIQSLCIS